MSNQKAQDELVIKQVKTDSDILACFDLMRELRPSLISAELFLQQVKRMSKQGYRLLAAWEKGIPIALAGYRDQEMIIHGKFIYVDDLITKKSERGKNLGELLLRHIFKEAQQLNYSSVMLDTGISNSLAQRFYFRVGMLPVALHFSYPIKLQN